MCQNLNLIIVYNCVITWCKTVDETKENTSRREKYSLCSYIQRQSSKFVENPNFFHYYIACTSFSFLSIELHIIIICICFKFPYLLYTIYLMNLILIITIIIFIYECLNTKYKIKFGYAKRYFEM